MKDEKKIPLKLVIAFLVDCAVPSSRFIKFAKEKKVNLGELENWIKEYEDKLNQEFFAIDDEHRKILVMQH